MTGSAEDRAQNQPLVQRYGKGKRTRTGRAVIRDHLLSLHLWRCASFQPCGWQLRHGCFPGGILQGSIHGKVAIPNQIHFARTQVSELSTPPIFRNQGRRSIQGLGGKRFIKNVAPASFDHAMQRRGEPCRLASMSSALVPTSSTTHDQGPHRRITVVVV